MGRSIYSLILENLYNHMMEIAQTYLGNLTEDSSLAVKVTQAREQASCLDVCLTQSDRRKGRIQTSSTSGEAIGIIKSRDWAIRPEDVFLTASDRLVVIQLQKEKLLVLSFKQPVTASAVELVHLGHILGNHHYPISIDQDKIYLQPGADFAIVEQTIKQLQIHDLVMSYEGCSQSIDRFPSPDSPSITPQPHHHH